MKTIELRDLDSEELAVRLSELKEEIFNLRFQKATGQLDDHRQIRRVKRDVARIRTILRERELAAWEEQQQEAVAEAAPEPAAAEARPPDGPDQVQTDEAEEDEA